MKKNIKTLLALFLSVSVLFILLAGCSGSKDNGSAKPSDTAKPSDSAQPSDGGEKTAEEGKKVAISVNSLNTIYYVDICEELKKLMGPNDELVILDSNEDATQQITNLEDALVKDYDLIFTTCLEPGGMRTIFLAAQDAGVPVIVFDFASEDPDLVATTIVHDDYQLGEIAAEGLAAAMNYEGTIIQYGSDMVAGPKARNQACRDVMEKYGIEILGYGDGIPMSEESYPKIEALITAHPEADGLWTMAAAAGVTGVAVMEAANNHDIKIVTIGVDDEIYSYIREGKLVGAVAQLPSVTAQGLWDAAQMVFDGKADELPEITYLDAYWCDASNVDEYDPQ